MLDKYIEKQLNQLHLYEEGKYEYDIGISEPPKLLVGHQYYITVEDYIVHPYQGFTLHDQWNGGIIPTTPDLHIVVTHLQQKMVCVDGFCSDNTEWRGWIPIKSIKSVQEG